MEMGLRLAGTEELSQADDPPRWRRAAVLTRLAKQMFPNLNVDKGTRWSGPRPGTPDGLPAIGPLPGHPNIFVACGHGHLGLTGGPNTGRIVAGLAAGERINLDLAPFAADRYVRLEAARGLNLMSDPRKWSQDESGSTHVLTLPKSVPNCAVPSRQPQGCRTGRTVDFRAGLWSVRTSRGRSDAMTILVEADRLSKSFG